MGVFVLQHIFIYIVTYFIVEFGIFYGFEVIY